MSSRKAAVAPRPPIFERTLEATELTALAHDSDYTELELSESELADSHAGGVALDTARLTQVDLSGSRLEKLKLLDVALESCNLANVVAPRADITRLVVSRNRWTGINLAQAGMRDVAIRDTRIDLASFSFAQLERVEFVDCLLAGSDFMEAKLESVCFTRCDLSGVDFRGAKMSACELRDCDLGEIQGVEGLRGVAMAWPDIVAMAGVWANALGIEQLERE